VSHNNFAASSDHPKRRFSADNQWTKGNQLMEATITQSGALYLARRNPKDRRRYFQQMRIAALDQGAVVRTLHNLTRSPLLHSDNGK
jgi:hypothetical protein